MGYVRYDKLDAGTYSLNVTAEYIIIVDIRAVYQLRLNH